MSLSVSNEEDQTDNCNPLVIMVNNDRWEEGVQVILDVQKETHLPDLTIWPPEIFVVHTRKRQANALNIWLAIVDDKVVGHALLSVIPSDHSDWIQIRNSTIAQALIEHRLVEMGGLAVLSAYNNRGIASALISARLKWAEKHPNFIVVSSIWHNSIGSNKLAQRYGHKISIGLTGPFDLFVYSDIS